MYYKAMSMSELTSFLMINFIVTTIENIVLTF